MLRSARLPSQRVALRALSPFLESFPEIVGLPEDRRFAITVATQEIVTNAIIHGNAEQQDLPVDISVDVRSNEIVIFVRDYGKGFVPEKVQDPRLPENRERPNGRGLLFAMELSDGIAFIREDPGMLVSLTFFRP